MEDISFSFFMFFLHIEKGFQDKMKTIIVLMDLSSAFDTVWKDTVHTSPS